MTKILINRTPTSGNEPVDLQPGELSIEMSTPTRLWVGVPLVLDPTGKKLLNQVVDVGEVPSSDRKQGDLWFEADTGILWLWYDDSTSQQWVQVNGAPAAPGSGGGGGGSGDYVLKTGDTMSGALNVTSSISASPTMGYLLNSIMFVDRPADFTRIHGEGAGGAHIAIGNLAAQTTYYNDQTHIWRSRDGLTTFGSIGVTGAVFSIAATFNQNATVSAAAPRLIINKSASGENSRIVGSTANSPRWSIDLGDAAAETGVLAGSNFAVNRYDDSGALAGVALHINRSTGYVTAAGSAFIGAPSGVYLAAGASGGTVILRPNGMGGVAGQVIVTANGTIVTESNGFNSGGFTSPRIGSPTQSGHLTNSGLGFTLNATGQSLVFATDGITRAFIDYTSGSFTCNAPAASNYYGFTATGTSEAGAVMGWVTGQTAYGVSGAYFAGIAYSFYGNSGAYLSAGSWAASDVRLKTVAGTMDPTAALAAVNAIAVKRFTPKSNTAKSILYGDDAPAELFGWIADEVKTHVPLAVRDVGIPAIDLQTRAALRGLPSVPEKDSTEADALSGAMSIRTINDHYMIATLWAAVQKLSAEVEALKGTRR